MRKKESITESIIHCENGFNNVWKLHYDKLCKFAKDIVQHKQVAEEIVSDAYLTLWRLRDNFDNPQNIRAFLYTTVKNACFNYLKKRKHEKETIQRLAYLATILEDRTTEGRLTEAEHTEQLNRIKQAIEKLPPKRRKIITLIFMEGLSAAMVAEQLGRKKQSVLNTKNNGIKALQKALKNKPE